MKKFKTFWHLVKQAAIGWKDDRAASMGAALSYYSVFSLAPLLIIVIAVAGMLFGREAVQGEVVAQLRGLIGKEGAIAIEGAIKSAWDPQAGVVAIIVGLVAMFIGATTAFVELQDDLDRIWKVPPLAGSGVLNFIKARLLSFGLVLGIGFLLIVSLVLSAGLAAMGRYWSGWFGEANYLLEAVNFFVSFGVVTALFAMIYKLLPHTPIEWREVWVGAAVTALLFAAGKTLIGLYLGNSAPASSFGAAGAIVVLFIWFYYSAQIFLFGAEFTKAYADYHRPQPASVQPGHPTSAAISSPQRKHKKTGKPSLWPLYGLAGFSGWVVLKSLRKPKR